MNRMHAPLTIYENPDISWEEALGTFIQQFDDDMKTIIGCYEADLEAAPDEWHRLFLEGVEKMLTLARRMDEAFITVFIRPLVSDSQDERKAAIAMCENGFFLKDVAKIIREVFAIDQESE